MSLDAAPCAIRAAAEGEQSAVMAVQDAPAGCAGLATAPPGEEVEEEEDD